MPSIPHNATDTEAYRIRQTSRCLNAAWGTQVHVENMAAAHLIAAQHLHRTVASNPVAGEAFNISDFSQNIVSLCERAHFLCQIQFACGLWPQTSLLIRST